MFSEQQCFFKRQLSDETMFSHHAQSLLEREEQI